MVALCFFLPFCTKRKQNLQAFCQNENVQDKNLAVYLFDDFKQVCFLFIIHRPIVKLTTYQSVAY